MIPVTLFKEEPFYDVQYLKALSSIALGDNYSAKSYLESFLLIGKDSQYYYDAKYELGIILLRENNEREGAELLEEVRKSTRKMALRSRAALALSRVYLKRGPQEAIPYLEDAVSLEDPEEQKSALLLLSKAYLEGFYYRPRIDKELLSGHAEGLIGLSSCLKGEVAFYLGKETDEAAEQAALEYSTFFGPGNFYLEIQDHGLPLQKAVNPKIIALARTVKAVLVKQKAVLADPPFNYYLHQGPNPHLPHEAWVNLEKSYHWHMEIIPVLTRVAGFEWGTGFYINPVMPEVAAGFLREG